MFPLKLADPAELENADEGSDGLLDDDEAVPDASVGSDRLLWLEVVLPETFDRCPARLAAVDVLPLWAAAAVAAVTPGLCDSCEIVSPFKLRCRMAHQRGQPLHRCPLDAHRLDRPSETTSARSGCKDLRFSCSQTCCERVLNECRQARRGARKMLI